MGDLLNKWRSAKKLFKTTAKVKKPSPAVDKFASKTLGIEKTLIKLEAAQDKGINDNVKAFAAWQAAALQFRVAKTSYLVVLDSTVGKEPAGADKDAYRKGIAVLKTHLNSLDSTIKVFTTRAQSRQNGVNSALQLMAESLMDDVEAGCAAALAFTARVKANPTPDEFNDGIEKAARDITQNIGNINTLTTKGHQFAKAQPTQLFNVLTAWANQGRRVPATAAAAKVLSEVKVFEQAVNGVKRWAA